MDNDSTVTNDINVVIKIKHDGEVLYSCVVDYEAVYDNRRCYIIRSDIQPVDLVAVMIEHGIQRVHFDSLQGIAMHNDNEGSADHSMLIVSNRNETCNRNNCQDASFSTSYRRIRSILTSMLCISSGSIDSIASQPFILPLWSSQSHTFGQFFPSSRLCSEGYLKFLNTFSHLFDVSQWVSRSVSYHYDNMHIITVDMFIGGHQNAARKYCVCKCCCAQYRQSNFIEHFNRKHNHPRECGQQRRC